MFAVTEHELTMYFHSMKAYVFGAFLLVFTGIGALIYNINQAYANFEFVLAFISITFVVLVPLLTMRVMAEEKAQKTDQLLFSLPISTTQIVLGKFAAMAVVFLIPVAIICVFPALFSMFGDVYLPTSYGTILAFFFLGLALLSMGMFVSCLTESQSMAAGISTVLMMLMYYCDTLAGFVSSSVTGSVIGLLIVIAALGLLIRTLTRSGLAGVIGSLILCAAVAAVCGRDPAALNGLLPEIIGQLSLFSRFDAFVNGVFDVTALVYDVSVIVFFLFLCVQALEKRRYNG